MSYDFFDYKYNIAGYSGQDFESIIRILYLVISVFVLPWLISYMKHKGSKFTLKFMKFMAVYLIIEEIFKISWESYWDITTGQGFNAGGILPLDTCSIFLYVLPLAAYGKGRLQRCALSWMSSIGVIAGFSYFLFPMVLKWYPIFTFGAWHSLMFHFMMVFIGLTVSHTGLYKAETEDIINGYLPQLIMAIPVIFLDWKYGWDYMLLRNASGIPFIEDLAVFFQQTDSGYMTTVIMMLIYFLIVATSTIIHGLISSFSPKLHHHRIAINITAVTK